MTAEQHHPDHPRRPGRPEAAVRLSLRTGGQDDALEKLLDEELTAFNGVACGAGTPEEFSVRVEDAAGEPAGGLTGYVWGGLCAVHLLWVREDLRGAG
ncbi:hypothetical protein ACFWHW_11650 [Streptomyces pharetrae]